MAFHGILSLTVFLPLLGAGIIMCIPSKEKAAIRAVAVLATGISALMGILIYSYSWANLGQIGFDDPNKFLLVEHLPWIPEFGISYYMGIDGFSGPMLMLSSLLSFLAVFVSWKIDTGVKGYFALLLLLCTSMMGVFCALDFFLFYIFWELMLLPMYFLIGIWGGPRREYAAIKFFLFTLAGSVLMLVVMIYLYLQTGIEGAGYSFENFVAVGQSRTFNLFRIMEVARSLDAQTQQLVWLGLAIGFAIKVPLFPFHTWLPDAHVEAPTAISVILAGILLKMGTYGFLRFNMTMLPAGHIYWADTLALFGVINIVYGAMVAMAQTDFKKLVAYSSISHMGYVMLGFAAMSSMSITGATFQMFTHGTSAAMLFMVVGVIYDRAHHRDINGFGGLGVKMPIYYGISIVGIFAALGLPGLSGFISEAFVLLGSYEAYPVYTIIGCFGVVLTAAYLLWTVKRVYLGKLNPRYENIPDISGREMFCMAPLAILAIVLGVLPGFIITLINGTAAKLAYFLNP